jgi:hypothetical protein
MGRDTAIKLETYTLRKVAEQQIQKLEHGKTTINSITKLLQWLLI